MNSNEISLQQQLAKFEAIYCSGMFIPEPAIVTAMALLFEKTHLLNNLDLVINLSRFFQLNSPLLNKDNVDIEYKLEAPHYLRDFLSLSKEQAISFLVYCRLGYNFFKKYSLLFSEVFSYSFLPCEIENFFNFEERENGSNFISLKLEINNSCIDDMNRLTMEGKVPVIYNIIPHEIISADQHQKSEFSAKQIAAMLALKSVAIILPATKAAEPETILEARFKLKDHLPPFWSSMLKLSEELRKKLGEKGSELRLQREVDNAVDTIVRPALIDLINKLEKERKNWFFKILSPVTKGLRVIVGNPPVSTAELISTSLKLSSDIAFDVSDQIRKVNALKQESGLTYLLELHKRISNR
ncbi:MAG: hypothetical protein C4567_06950 [Deltaproteobacteria bacterium]|nr:MAG: hypothetical protein C4567_06950 [Deltaproteobacteria bacterium]